MQHGAEWGAAGRNLRGLDDEVERGGFRVGGRFADGDCLVPKLTAFENEITRAAAKPVDMS